jgi:hypothetical protein
MSRNDDQKYYSNGTKAPTSPPPGGRVICHNLAIPKPSHVEGENGFRFWHEPLAQVEARGWKECRCGWAPKVLHYSVTGRG